MDNESMRDTRVLVVEDDALVAGLVETRLAEQGFNVTVVSDGLAAWELLSSDKPEFETILLDRSMPHMDGMTLLGKLRALPELANVPVIMSTAMDDRASVLEGMQAGAYFYLTKPLQPELLLTIVRAAVQQYREYRELRQLVDDSEHTQRYLSAATFHFRTVEDVHSLSHWLAGLCPEPGRVALGFQELMFNAVEHGNLGFTYDEKGRLLLEDQWFTELKRRQDMPEHQGQRVEVTYERRADALYFTIRDEGEGFDWHRFLDFDPERMFDPNGRGIAMARAKSFDGLEYLGNGNTVRVWINTPT